MTILQSLILGLVEGLTEYLPVSSTGHLIITQYLLGLGESDALNAYSVCIQSGAILAVLNLYFARVGQMWRGVLGKNPSGLKLAVNLLLGFLPAMVIGFFLAKPIKNFLFNAETVLISWAIGGIVILLYVRHCRKTGNKNNANGIELEAMNWKQALTVGFMQCIAMCPGTSRSLMTMLGGLVAGLSMAAAVEFSFLLGLITLSAATVYDFTKYGDNMVAEIGWGPMLAGTFMAQRHHCGEMDGQLPQKARFIHFRLVSHSRRHRDAGDDSARAAGLIDPPGHTFCFSSGSKRVE